MSEQTNLTQLMSTLPKIEAAGGTKFSSCYDLATGMVEAKDDQGESAWYFCPQACEAAVIAYAREVCAWMNRTEEGHNLNVQPDDESSSWGFDCWFNGEPGPCGSCASQLEASIALILAVAERVGGGE